MCFEISRDKTKYHVENRIPLRYLYMTNHEQLQIKLKNKIHFG